MKLLRQFIASIRVGWVTGKVTYKYLRAGMDININVTWTGQATEAH